MALGLAAFRRGSPPRATHALERCLDLCRTWQLVAGIAPAAATLGAAHALAGRPDEALALVTGAVDESRASKSFRWAVPILLHAGLAFFSAARFEEAIGYSGEALALSRRLKARGGEAHALLLAGDVASKAAAGDAEGYYREGLAIAGELGMRPVVAHCHRGLGHLYRRTGQVERAREHLTGAATIYREMGMTHWLPSAQPELE